MICVSDIPVGANMRFVMKDDRIFEGRVLHNYGRGIVLVKADESGVVEFDGGNASEVETLDAESASLWRQSISKSQAEHKQWMERLSQDHEQK